MVERGRVVEGKGMDGGEQDRNRRYAGKEVERRGRRRRKMDGYRWKGGTSDRMEGIDGVKKKKGVMKRSENNRRKREG